MSVRFAALEFFGDCVSYADALTFEIVGSISSIFERYQPG